MGIFGGWLRIRKTSRRRSCRSVSRRCSREKSKVASADHCGDDLCGKENRMSTSDTIFQRALGKLLSEIFDGPPGNEGYLLNPGDPGLLRQLESIDARAASTRP